MKNPTIEVEVTLHVPVVVLNEQELQKFWALHKHHSPVTEYGWAAFADWLSHSQPKPERN